MKTFAEFGQDSIDLTEGTMTIVEKDYKAIQLDAFKAGAKWAAKEVEERYECPSTSDYRMSEYILTATEQLTKLP